VIIGKETNTVYVSELLSTASDFSEIYEKLIEILDRHNIIYKFLEGTIKENDIWCRDYMPLQVNENKYMRFHYEPRYLNDEEGRKILRSDPAKVCQVNGIDTVFSPIILDGGNVISWSDRVIISDRVYDENPEYEKDKLVSEIEKLLDAEVIIIPQINTDMTGHADGMVRFVDRNTLIGNSRDEEYKYWARDINKVLKQHNIDYIDVSFLSNDSKKNPLSEVGYVNYLEVLDLIVMPVFELPESKETDAKAIALFHEIFGGDRKIETINYNAIAKHGGLLNCTTWTVKENNPNQ
jgi:agmatine deiminase